MKKILVIEDDLFARRHAMALLAVLKDITHVGQVNNILEGMEFLKTERPHLVILDLHLPHHSLALYYIRPIKRLVEGIKILILTGDRQPKLLASCLKLGADGIMTKETPDLIGAAIRFVLDKDEVFLLHASAFKIMMAYCTDPVISTLTAQELEIFLQQGCGKKPREIAHMLQTISTKTISNRILDIKNKLGVGSPSELADYCRAWLAAVAP